MAMQSKKKEGGALGLKIRGKTRGGTRTFYQGGALMEWLMDPCRVSRMMHKLQHNYTCRVSRMMHKLQHNYSTREVAAAQKFFATRFFCPKKKKKGMGGFGRFLGLKF